MKKTDLNVVAPLVVEYYKWLSDNGGTDPQTLLSHPLTATQRRLLLDRMDDVNVVWSITSPLRRAASAENARPAATAQRFKREDRRNPRDEKRPD